MTGLLSTLSTIWQLTLPYFRSDERWPGRFLLGAIIAIELLVVAVNVMLNQWNARFYNALQDRNWNTFVTELLVFCALAGIFIVLRVYQLYLNQWLQIRWRRWMTEHYLTRWLKSGTHYRMQLLGDAADNPDQRIAEDIQLFIDRTLSMGIGLLGSTVSLISFIAILWVLSEDAPLHLFGADWPIPGYLVWAALIYSIIGTWITHLIGRPLIALNFQQQQFEADFRFNLVRTRENSEQIALLSGETMEQHRLLDRFRAIIGNWLLIMSRTKRLSFFTYGFGQASVVFPFIMVSPAYFAGAMQLGGLTQTASAFNSVQTSLSFFIDTYRTLAEWRSVIARLAGFDEAINAGRSLAVTPPVIKREHGSKPHMQIDTLDVALPAGTALFDIENISFARGERVLVTGPSGSGKSTLFRAIGGIWPFGAGTIQVPQDAHVMVLPQRPYLPIGSLAAAITYPAAPEKFDPELIREVLTAIGMPALKSRLEEEAHWSRMLSAGEQQRLAIARAILHAPDYLFLDEATASLDEAAEAQIYRVLNEWLVNTAIISIGHQSSLHAFHHRHLRMVSEEKRHWVREAKRETVAG